MSVVSRGLEIDYVIIRSSSARGSKVGKPASWDDFYQTSEAHTVYKACFLQYLYHLYIKERHNSSVKRINSFLKSPLDILVLVVHLLPSNFLIDDGTNIPIRDH